MGEDDRERPLTNVDQIKKINVTVNKIQPFKMHVKLQPKENRFNLAIDSIKSIEKKYKSHGYLKTEKLMKDSLASSVINKTKFTQKHVESKKLSKPDTQASKIIIKTGSQNLNLITDLIENEINNEEDFESEEMQLIGEKEKLTKELEELKQIEERKRSDQVLLDKLESGVHAVSPPIIDPNVDELIHVQINDTSFQMEPEKNNISNDTKTSNKFNDSENTQISMTISPSILEEYKNDKLLQVKKNENIIKEDTTVECISSDIIVTPKQENITLFDIEENGKGKDRTVLERDRNAPDLEATTQDKESINSDSTVSYPTNQNNIQVVPTTVSLKVINTIPDSIESSPDTSKYDIQAVYTGDTENKVSKTPEITLKRKSDYDSAIKINNNIDVCIEANKLDNTEDTSIESDTYVELSEQESQSNELNKAENIVPKTPQITPKRKSDLTSKTNIKTGPDIDANKLENIDEIKLDTNLEFSEQKSQDNKQNSPDKSDNLGSDNSSDTKVTETMFNKNNFVDITEESDNSSENSTNDGTRDVTTNNEELSHDERVKKNIEILKPGLTSAISKENSPTNRSTECDKDLEDPVFSEDRLLSPSPDSPAVVSKSEIFPKTSLNIVSEEQDVGNHVDIVHIKQTEKSSKINEDVTNDNFDEAEHLLSPNGQDLVQQNREENMTVSEQKLLKPDLKSPIFRTARKKIDNVEPEIISAPENIIFSSEDKNMPTDNCEEPTSVDRIKSPELNTKRPEININEVKNETTDDNSSKNMARLTEGIEKYDNEMVESKTQEETVELQNNNETPISTEISSEDQTKVPFFISNTHDPSGIPLSTSTKSDKSETEKLNVQEKSDTDMPKIRNIKEGKLSLDTTEGKESFLSPCDMTNKRKSTSADKPLSPLQTVELTPDETSITDQISIVTSDTQPEDIDTNINDNEKSRDILINDENFDSKLMLPTDSNENLNILDNSSITNDTDLILNTQIFDGKSILNEDIKSTDTLNILDKTNFESHTTDLNTPTNVILQQTEEPKGIFSQDEVSDDILIPQGDTKTEQTDIPSYDFEHEDLSLNVDIKEVEKSKVKEESLITQTLTITDTPESETGVILKTNTGQNLKESIIEEESKEIEEDLEVTNAEIDNVPSNFDKPKTQTTESEEVKMLITEENQTERSKLSDLDTSTKNNDNTCCGVLWTVFNYLIQFLIFGVQAGVVIGLVMYYYYRLCVIHHRQIILWSIGMLKISWELVKERDKKKDVNTAKIIALIVAWFLIGVYLKILVAMRWYMLTPVYAVFRTII